jgi:hypothetical protein
LNEPEDDETEDAYEWRDDPEPTLKSGPVVEDRELKREQQRHVAWMQTRVLIGVGLIVVITFETLVLAVGFGGISTATASELGRMVLPALVGAGSTIVGALFLRTGERQ